MHWNGVACEDFFWFNLGIIVKIDWIEVKFGWTPQKDLAVPETIATNF